MFFNLFRAPKPKVDTKGMPFLKQVGMIVLSTTISLSLTLGVLQFLDTQNKKKDRRLSAMMVMSNIESFARTLEERSEALKETDSIGAWLLALPMESLDTLPEEPLYDMVKQVILTATITIEHDHTAENIFSNDINVWKNLGNFAFIDNVGRCFADINFVENYWNGWTDEVETLTDKIYLHPDEYKGKSSGSKLLHNEEIRKRIDNIHERCFWLKYVAAQIRYDNRLNMKAIGISEKEVIEFTDSRIKNHSDSDSQLDPKDYYTAPLTPDSSNGVWQSLYETLSE